MTITRLALLLLLLTLAAYAHGQKSTSTPWIHVTPAPQGQVGISATGDLLSSWTQPFPESLYDHPLPDSKYVLVWQTRELDYASPWRFAVMCTNSSIDCGVPPKTVTHYGWFHDQADAIALANSQNLDVVGLYTIQQISLIRADHDQHAPQPDLITPVHHYEYRPHCGDPNFICAEAITP